MVSRSRTGPSMSRLPRWSPLTSPRTGSPVRDGPGAVRGQSARTPAHQRDTGRPPAPLVRPVGRGPGPGPDEAARVRVLPVGARVVSAAWNRFWFEPRSTATLAVVRIAVGLVVLLWGISVAPDVRTFFSGDGVLARQPHFEFWYGVLGWARGDAALWLVYAVLL